MAAKGAKPAGRPSKLTPAIVDAICERLGKGEPLAAICRDDGMPGLRTVYDWGDADPEVSARIARAREEGEEAIAAECLQIADDARNDYMVRVSSGESEAAAGAAIYNSEHVQRSKLRIETRLKLLAKWNPKKWGDKLQTELSGTVGLNITRKVYQPDA